MKVILNSGVEARCIACGSKITVKLQNLFDTRFGIEKVWDICRCADCGMEQTIPVPSLEELERLYETYYNFGGEKETIYTRFRELFLSSKLYRFWLAIDGDISFHRIKGSGRLETFAKRDIFLSGKKGKNFNRRNTLGISRIKICSLTPHHGKMAVLQRSLLDIGCNEGRGLKIYKQNGFKAEGLEPNDKAADVAREHGFSVHTESVEQFKPARPYDICVLSNVLEHSLDPKNMLFHVHRILKPGGQVWISLPNANSWLRYVFGRYWINWHVPFHIVHFSPEALKRLLQDAGFNVDHVAHKTPALWVAHSILSFLFAKPGRVNRCLRSPFLVAFLMLVVRFIFFPILWLGNLSGRGDCLAVVGVKSADYADYTDLKK